MMNDKIYEFATQAGLITFESIHDSMAVTPSIESVAKARKFAELIVRECASICELNGQSYTHSFTPAKARLAESTSNHCGLMIKKHFGVEE
jgi:hypothetical protein